MKGQARLPSLRSGASGQALINLIFFTVIATTVTTAAILMVYVNLQSGTRLQQGIVAYEIAQSGAENGLIRLLRDTSYNGENGLVVGSGTVDILVTGSGTSADPYVILSKGKIGNYLRQVQIRATYVDNQLTVLSRKEVSI